LQTPALPLGHVASSDFDLNRIKPECQKLRFVKNSELGAIILIEELLSIRNRDLAERDSGIS
jgi:hypothetical protein